VLPKGWPWIVTATFFCGFVIRFFNGTRSPRAKRAVLRLPESRTHGLPVARAVLCLAQELDQAANGVRRVASLLDPGDDACSHELFEP
jgi:hypothetical protein